MCIGWQGGHQDNQTSPQTLTPGLADHRGGEYPGVTPWGGKYICILTMISYPVCCCPLILRTPACTHVHIHTHAGTHVHTNSHTHDHHHVDVGCVWTHHPSRLRQGRQLPRLRSLPEFLHPSVMLLFGQRKSALDTTLMHVYIRMCIRIRILVIFPHKMITARHISTA